MHINPKSLRRLLTPGLAIAVMLPLGTMLTAVVTLEQRHEAASELNDSLDTALKSYRRRQGLKYIESRGEEALAEERHLRASLAQQKRAVRLQLADVLKQLAAVRERYGIREENPDRLNVMLREAKRMLLDEAKTSYMTSGDDETRSALKLLLEGNGPGVLDRPEAAMQVVVLEGLQRTADLSMSLHNLRARHEQLIADYNAVDKAAERSAGIVRVSEAEMAQIQQIVRDVHEQVLLLQSQLARIDAQLKERAERALIEKGLMAPQSARDGPAPRPLFTWPAFGTLSAGFHNEKYEQYFGVPHEGVDIVVGQGSPVYSAADGIVFLVREGGKTGYTYVLIGHASGYATLYGHLSSVVVVAGQRVTAGQMIGLSGGKPGTDGAGPMTTGPHLHFEMIQGGTNIDPLTVLPQ